MAPILPEPAPLRTRRQPFVATCSPDELLGQIVQALLPKYNIDASHLLALRQVVSSVVVAPRKPPTLKRTRPDRHIGEISSVHDTPRSSIYGPNGPPASVDQSFFFHHQDPEFTRLLPQVDRSRYQWPDEPASEPSSDGEEVLGSQGGLSSMVSDASAAVTVQRGALLQPATAPAYAPADRRRRPTVRVVQRTKECCNPEDRTAESSLLIVDNSPQEGATTNLRRPIDHTIPAITVTTPTTSTRNANIVQEDVPVLLPSLHKIDRSANPPTAQDDSAGTESSFPSASPILILTDTQGTVDSTQPSEVFSPMDNFVHYSPPSQGDTQDEAMSQALPLAVLEPTVMTAKSGGSRRSSINSLPSSSQSAPFEFASGKRSREGATDNPARLKRRKSTE